MTAPAITVVIPSRRRPDRLRLALDGLARQCDPGATWEVVVVDNDEPPGTAASGAAEALDALPVPARIVVEPSVGTSYARNRGIAEAGGAVVVFIDDDVVPTDDWLASLVEPLLTGRCDAVGGRVVLDPATPRPRWLTDWLRPFYAEYDLGDTELDLLIPGAGGLVEPLMLTANAAFTADALERSGGFDLRLGPRGRVPLANEEPDLCRRIAAIGGRIRYVPNATVVHELPESRLNHGYVARRLYAQGRSDWLLDEETLAPSRSSGVAAAVRFLASDVRRLWGEDRFTPPATWLLASLARRAGFLREALANLWARQRSSER